MHDTKHPAARTLDGGGSAPRALAGQPQQLLTAAQTAREVYGVSERQFHLMRNRGLVPAPVELGARCLRWVRRECEESLCNLPRQTAPQPMPAQLRRAKIERIKVGGPA